MLNLIKSLIGEANPNAVRNLLYPWYGYTRPNLAGGIPIICTLCSDANITCDGEFAFSP